MARMLLRKVIMGIGPLLLLAMMAAYFIGGARPVFATSYEAKANGNWGTAGTWTPSGVPGSSDTVTIDAGVTVTMEAAHTIGGLTLSCGNGSTINGNYALTLNGPVTVNYSRFRLNRCDNILSGDINNDAYFHRGR